MARKWWAKAQSALASNVQEKPVLRVGTTGAISGERSELHGRAVLAVTLALLMTACATGPQIQDDGTTVRTEVGLAGCSGCTEIHMFTSRTLASDMYAVKDANDLNTGAHIAASLSLGVSNRQSGVVDGLSVGPAGVAYLATITGPDAYFFQREALTDSKHPYRLFVRVHHNSSFMRQDVQLVEGGKFQSVPAMHFDGVDLRQNCYASGCVWDADYVISAKVANDHIAAGTPLQFFIGSHPSRQVQSQDGLNKSYETVNSGLFLKISVKQLQNFMSAVRQNLAS